jgi:putative ABC transport system permease protein
MEYSSSGTVNKAAVTGTKVGPDFQRHFPEIEAFTRTIKGSRVITVADKVFTENNILFADSAFFSIFSFSFLQGDPYTCLNSPGKVVLSRSIAEKYFGSTDIIGRTIKVVNNPDLMVSGVMEEVPGNTQLHFDIVMPFMNLRAAKQEEQWFTANYVTYLLLTGADKINRVQQQVSNYMKVVSAKELYTTEKGYLTHHLEPLKSVHLHSSLDGLEPNGNKTSVYIMSIIAFLILLIACVNYTNLAVAQSGGRSIEIGIRKVLGAKKNQLVFQFLSESFILTCTGILFSVILCILLLPYFNSTRPFSPYLDLVQPTVLFLMVWRGCEHGRTLSCITGVGCTIRNGA